MAAPDCNDRNESNDLDENDRMAAMHHLDPADRSCTPAFVPAEPEALAGPFDDRLNGTDLASAAHSSQFVAGRLTARLDEAMSPDMFVDFVSGRRKPDFPAMDGPVIARDPLQRQRLAQAGSWHEQAIFTEEHASGRHAEGCRVGDDATCRDRPVVPVGHGVPGLPPAWLDRGVVFEEDPDSAGGRLESRGAPAGHVGRTAWPDLEDPDPQALRTQAVGLSLKPIVDPIRRHDDHDFGAWTGVNLAPERPEQACKAAPALGRRDEDRKPDARIHLLGHFHDGPDHRTRSRLRPGPNRYPTHSPAAPTAITRAIRGQLLASVIRETRRWASVLVALSVRMAGRAAEPTIWTNLRAGLRRSSLIPAYERPKCQRRLRNSPSVNPLQ